jgi:hypothetical protein
MTAPISQPGAHSASGFSLLETVFALSLLMVVAIGLLPLGVVATTTTENQGHLMARTTEYAQDKMEQLLALSFNDVTSDTRLFPATDTGGTGLAIGGSAVAASPAANYVDYLDVNGSLMASSGTTAPTDWYYKRVWSVAYVSGSTTMTKIVVTATTRSAVGSTGRTPTATVSSVKTYPF